VAQLTDLIKLFDSSLKNPWAKKPLIRGLIIRTRRKAKQCLDIKLGIKNAIEEALKGPVGKNPLIRGLLLRTQRKENQLNEISNGRLKVFQEALHGPNGKNPMFRGLLIRCQNKAIKEMARIRTQTIQPPPKDPELIKAASNAKSVEQLSLVEVMSRHLQPELEVEGLNVKVETI
jgi:hypothetical protein